jgi:hypothetical protein
MACKHTTCRHCGQDIEGCFPYRKGEWRDRGNNAECPFPIKGYGDERLPAGTVHAPVKAPSAYALAMARNKGQQ